MNTKIKWALNIHFSHICLQSHSPSFSVKPYQGSSSISSVTTWQPERITHCLQSGDISSSWSSHTDGEIWVWLFWGVDVRVTSSSISVGSNRRPLDRDDLILVYWCIDNRLTIKHCRAFLNVAKIVTLVISKLNWIQDMYLSLVVLWLWLA